MTTGTQINDSTFAAGILDQSGLVAAKFTAEWCAPCRVLSPIFDAVATSYASKARFVEVNGDASPQASVRFGVRGLPTILFFKDGEVVSRLVGAVPRGHIEKELERLIG